MEIHIPVLLEETLSFLNCKKDGVYVDMTVGAGGHSFHISHRLDENGYLIGLDRDPGILSYAVERLSETNKKYALRHCSFSQVGNVLREMEIPGVDGFLFDLGVSSYQLDNSERGFSFMQEGPLDMRMDPENDLTAESIVNGYDEATLANVFFRFGEEPRSRRIARAIVKARHIKKIRSTLELANLVAKASGYTRGRTHPATRVFQALRIAVNQELEELENGLQNILPFLKNGARVVVISFHSLEDRIVKHFFKSQRDRMSILTKKPLRATPEEERVNPRSRSAKLRCMEWRC